MSKKENKSNMHTTEVKMPIVLEELTSKEFDELMERAIHSYEDGEGIPFEQFNKNLRATIGI